MSEVSAADLVVIQKAGQDKGRFGFVYLNGHLGESFDISALTQIKYEVSGVEIMIYEG